MQKALPKLEVLEVANAKHPAPFNATVCGFVLQGLGVHQAQTHSGVHAHAEPLPHPVIEPLLEPHVSTPQHPPPARWWHKVIRRLNAKEK
jgi:hypothetical protein